MSIIGRRGLTGTAGITGCPPYGAAGPPIVAKSIQNSGDGA